MSVAASPSRRALLIECCPYHEELFPAWRHMLADAGYELDIASLGGPRQRQVLAAMGSPGSAPDESRFFQVDRWHEIPLQDYAFVLLASLVHAGYGLETPEIARYYGFAADAPLPDLELLRQIGLPSLAISHEPAAWGDDLPIECFDFVRDGLPVERAFLRLLADGHWSADGQLSDGPDHRARWIWRHGEYESVGEPRRRLHLTGKHKAPLEPGPAGEWQLESSDGGESFSSRSGQTRLLRRPYRRPDLVAHLNDRRHAVAALSPPARDSLARDGADVEWLLPFELARGVSSPGSATEFVFAAGIDPRRKTLDALLDAVATTGQDIVMVGGTRDPAFDEDQGVRQFRKEIAKRHLGHHFQFTGHLDHRSFLDRVSRARFLLPLVDDRIEGGIYRARLPAVILLSLCFGVPMIMDESLARIYGPDWMLTYTQGDLAAGIEAARNLDDEAYGRLRAAVIKQAETQRRHNRQTLKRVLERILGSLRWQDRRQDRRQDR